MARIVAFSGVDGSGKTSQARALADWLAMIGVRADLFPSVPAESIGLLEDCPELDVPQDWIDYAVACDRIRTLQAFLSRRQDDRVVVADRYAWDYIVSASVYGSSKIAQMVVRILIEKHLPPADLCFFLDIRPPLATARIEARGEVNGNAGFVARKSEYYHDSQGEWQFVRIDAEPAVKEVREQVRGHVWSWLEASRLALADKTIRSPSI